MPGTSKRPLRNHVGDPTRHLAKDILLNRLHEIRLESARKAQKKYEAPKPRYHGGGPAPRRRAKPMTRRKSLWKQLQSFFTRKRK